MLTYCHTFLIIDLKIQLCNCASSFAEESCVFSRVNTKNIEEKCITSVRTTCDVRTRDYRLSGNMIFKI